MEISTETLRAVIDERQQRYLERIRAVEQRMLDFRDAAEAALTIAKKENESSAQKLGEALVAYKETVNEWQGAFRDLRGSMISRDQFNAKIDAIEEKISKLEKQWERTGGSEDTKAASLRQQNWRIGVIVGVVALVLGLVYFVIGQM